ncbi:GPI mannosyltransferase 2 isoform X4 [Hyla sarda]|uniref:GPI mannosyltransferase 2 isoform X4 n=1 Tax=Hyla sarda TaxID=327740 RepID=UPI0024C3EF4B|nr:GPI mannosyltransferase 2 isoform X4 [Hyla sarda]
MRKYTVDHTGPVMGWYWSNCKTWWSQDPFLQEVVRFSLWCRGLTLLMQVLTRLLFSSCPVLFWFCSHVVHKNEPWIWSLKKCKTIYNPVIQFLIGWTSLQPGTKIILGYFLGYWVIGTALHVNFLPWT